MFYFYQILSSFNKLKTIRGCSTSTKYCHPLTSWRLYQRVFYFYQILSTSTLSPFNKLKTISEGVLLLPNTVTLEQVEDYIRGCSTSTKCCHPWTSWRLYQRVFYFYQILSSFNKLKTISEGVLLLPNTVTLEPSEGVLTSWRLYQRVFYFYQILSTLLPLNKLKTISEDVLILPNTVTLEQVEDCIRGCSTSTKYCHPWTSWRLYQRVFYFYQILSPLNELKTISEGVLLLPNTVPVKRTEDYIRGCSTSTKYCPH